jgi:hypothetical protein
MEITGINGLQQLAKPIPLSDRPNDQLALLDDHVDGRTCGYLGLDSE